MIQVESKLHGDQMFWILYTSTVPNLRLKVQHDPPPVITSRKTTYPGAIGSYHFQGSCQFSILYLYYPVENQNPQLFIYSTLSSCILMGLLFILLHCTLYTGNWVAAVPVILMVIVDIDLYVNTVQLDMENKKYHFFEKQS